MFYLNLSGYIILVRLTFTSDVNQVNFKQLCPLTSSPLACIPLNEMLLNTCYRLCKGYEQYRKMSNKEDVDTEPKAEIESDTKPEDNVAVPEDTEKVEGDDGNLYI